MSATRNIVIPVELTDHDDKAMKFVMEGLHRSGDVVNIVHVVKAAEPVREVYHSLGASVNVRTANDDAAEDEAVKAARLKVKERYTDAMDAAGIAHNLHLFLDTFNVPSQAVFEHIKTVCEQVAAKVVVMGTSHKSRFEKVVAGSVVDLAMKSYIGNRPKSPDAPVLVLIPSWGEE